MSAWTSNVELHRKGAHRDSLRLKDSDVSQCGTCGRKWCHTCNPTPASRCPFEYEHPEPDPTPDNKPVVSFSPDTRTAWIVTDASVVTVVMEGDVPTIYVDEELVGTLSLDPGERP